MHAAPKAIALFLLLGFAPALMATSAEQETKPPVEWDYSPFAVYGPTFTTADGANRLTLGFFSWLDSGFFLTDSAARAVGVTDLDGDTRVRTARLELHGQHAGYIGYYFRIDFQGLGEGSGDARLEWAAFSLSGLPFVRNLLIGQQMPLYSLDIWQAYPRHRKFIEPSLLNAFFRGPLLGVTAFDLNMEQGFNWFAGLYRDTTDDRLSGFQGVARGEDNYVAIWRGGWFPRFEEGGRYLTHFGITGAVLHPDGDTISFGWYPEIFTIDNPDLFSTIFVQDVDNAWLTGAEFRLSQGPFWMETDYMHNRVSRDNAGNLGLYAFQISTGFFLTGEHAAFSPLTLIGAVEPNRPVKPGSGGLGAVEVLARVSRLDMIDREFRGGPGDPADPDNPPIQGAKTTNFTLGLNWYLNRHAKIMVNYVSSKRHDLGGAHLDAVHLRFAWNI